MCKNEIFYIGKGCKSRCDNHLAEAKNESLDSFKIQRIRNCHASGNFQRIIISRHEEESQAFAVEAVLIKWVYGKQLVNDVDGHGHKFIREKGNFSTLIPGIEIERTSQHTGDFKKEKMDDLKESGAYEYREQLLNQFKQENFPTHDFSKIYKKYDPSESNGFIGFAVELDGIDVVVYFSKTLKPKIVLPTNKEFCREIEHQLSTMGLEVSDPIKHNTYRRIYKDGEEVAFRGSEDLIKFMKTISKVRVSKATA